MNFPRLTLLENGLAKCFDNIFKSLLFLMKNAIKFIDIRKEARVVVKVPCLDLRTTVNSSK